jgi:hypothetical protein
LATTGETGETRGGEVDRDFSAAAPTADKFFRDEIKIAGVQK